jgi:putative Mg2+ transporter-C (MgtC) family protein
MKELDKELYLGVPDTQYLMRVLVRLAVAAVLGGVVGLERERTGKAAGVRTHMLVCLGAALFTTVPLEAGMYSADFSRVIQGLVTGIGFLGGGAILKLSDQGQVRGLTTAAGIWVTAAAGMAVGAGWLWPALCGVALGWLILRFLRALEERLRPPDHPGGSHQA